MAGGMLKDKRFGTLLLVVLTGILFGSYLSTLIAALIPGEGSVVKTFFATTVSFGIGDFHGRTNAITGIEGPGEITESKKLNPLVIDLSAIKFQFGFQIKLGFMSIIGVFLALYFFRWYG